MNINSISPIQSPLINIYKKTMQTLIDRKDFYISVEDLFQKLQDSVSPALLSTFGKEKIVKISNPNVASAMASTQAPDISFNLSIKRLASKHTVASKVFTASGKELSNVSIDVNNNTFTVSNAENNFAALSFLADKINNSGVAKAYVQYNDDTGIRLVIQSNKTGSINALQINNGDALGLDDLTRIADDSNGGTVFPDVDTFSPDLLDAKALINELTWKSHENTGIPIEEITVTLKATGTTTISIQQDKDSPRKIIENVAAIYQTIKNKYGNDLTVRNALYTLRSLMKTELGFEFDKEGNVTVNYGTIDAMDYDILIEKIKNMAQNISSFAEERKHLFQNTANNYSQRINQYKRIIDKQTKILQEQQALLKYRESVYTSMQYQLQMQLTKIKQIFGF